MAREDRPAARRLLASTALFTAAAAATLGLARADSAAWIAPAIVGGFAYLTFFPALHECGHGTAFTSAAVNRAVCAGAALLMLQSPAFFREFHWQHHRQTQDRGLDPEIMSAPDLLDGWPTNPATYLLIASGQLLWPGKLLFTVSCALLPRALWLRIFPFVRPAQAARVAWESRAVLAILAAVIVGGLALIPGFWALMLIWPIGHVFLGLYLMAEHTGLANTGSQLRRTRTLTSTPALRWWMWNMPYHSEHHAYPAVPFHALGRLHALLGAEVENLSPGYLAFHGEALLRALGRRR